MPKVVLVVAAHADDEALGCGGTVARHVAEGDSVHLVLMADGVTSRVGTDSSDILRRNRAAKAAQDILGFVTVRSLEFPDNRLDSVPLLACVQALEAIIGDVRPDTIYTHYFGDLNIDHRRTQEAVMTACRPQPGNSIKEIYGFEVLSSTEWAGPQFSGFHPNVFVDISAYADHKMRALAAYADEMRPVPHTRSQEHADLMMRHRGNCVGVQAAEAFVAYRLVR